MAFKKYDLDYINHTKTELGYDPNSLNITVRNNATSFGKILLLGHFAAAASKFYNLSLEKDGLLFIQRDVWNNNLLKEKTFFISHDEIQDILLKKRLMTYKLIIVDKSGKKTVFLINKMFAGVKWHKDSLGQLEATYGAK